MDGTYMLLVSRGKGGSPLHRPQQKRSFGRKLLAHKGRALRPHMMWRCFLRFRIVGQVMVGRQNTNLCLQLRQLERSLAWYQLRMAEAAGDPSLQHPLAIVDMPVRDPRCRMRRPA